MVDNQTENKQDVAQSTKTTSREDITSLLRKYQAFEKRIADLTESRDTVRSKIDAEYNKHKSIVDQIDQIVSLTKGKPLTQMEAEPTKPTQVKPKITKPRAARHRGEVKAKIIEAINANPDATNVAIAKIVYGENFKGKDVYVSIIRSALRQQAQPKQTNNQKSS